MKFIEETFEINIPVVPEEDIAYAKYEEHMQLLTLLYETSIENVMHFIPFEKYEKLLIKMPIIDRTHVIHIMLTEHILLTEGFIIRTGSIYTSK